MATLKETLKNIKLTEKEHRVLNYLNHALQNYFGESFTDVDFKDISSEIEPYMSIDSVKGVVGSLVKKNILFIYEVQTDAKYHLIGFIKQSDLDFEDMGDYIELSKSIKKEKREYVTDENFNPDDFGMVGQPMNSTKFYKDTYRGFEIRNSNNTDGFSATTENEKYFTSKIQKTAGYRHCGNFNKLEEAKAWIDNLINPPNLHPVNILFKFAYNATFEEIMQAIDTTSMPKHYKEKFSYFTANTYNQTTTEGLYQFIQYLGDADTVAFCNHISNNPKYQNER